MSSLRLLSTSVLAASALMALAPPALAADAVDSATLAPIAAGDTLPATVLRDNLWTLAARVQRDPGVTRQQVMVAMLRRNPNAFLQGNMHRLRRDVALVVPTSREILAENAGAAEAVVAAHLQALELGAAVPPLAPVTGVPVAAAKPPVKGASATAAPAPAAMTASAARAAQTGKLPATPDVKPSAAVTPTLPAAPATLPQATATATPPAEVVQAASAVATQPATGSEIQAPAEVPAVVAPAAPTVRPVPPPSPAVTAAASAGAQPAAAEGDSGDLRWWPALAAVALLGAVAVVWMRRRPSAAAVADTAAPSSFFDDNGVRRQSRPKLIDVSQAGVETARTVETLQAAAQLVRGAEAGQVLALSSDDPYREATVKLEIARTSLELGRVETAKAMLQAVRREGSAAQQLLAGDLLHSLSPT